jgi:hypothetical protein
MKQSLEKVLHSLVHRSGVMIDVRNLYLKNNFNSSDLEILNICEKFRRLIVEMTCSVPLKMIGDNRKDGSYPIYLDTDFNSLNVISIGVGNNIIFDEGMAALGASVSCFDHTVAPRIKRKFKDKIKYFSLGVKGNQDIVGCITLSEIYKLSLNEKVYQNTILKMDCEGAEWDVLNDNSVDFLSQFDQICIELHELNKISNQKLAIKYIDVLEKLKNSFVITYIVANNFTPIIRLKNGMIWPFTIEIHLLNRNNVKFLDQKNIVENLPSDLSKSSVNWHLAPKFDLFEWYIDSGL